MMDLDVKVVEWVTRGCDCTWALGEHQEARSREEPKV